MLHQHGRMCAHTLARAHAHSGDPAQSPDAWDRGRRFEDAVGVVATEYTQQNHKDWEFDQVRNGSSGIET
jgi:hypothetical protein